MGWVFGDDAESLMAKNLQCNEDLVRDLLNFSPFGAMGQVFVMEAIRHYADIVVAGQDVNAPMPGTVWEQIAADVKARCDAFYSRHQTQETPDVKPDAATSH
jgi:hypothetical protein